MALDYSSSALGLASFEANAWLRHLMVNLSFSLQIPSREGGRSRSIIIIIMLVVVVVVV